MSTATVKKSVTIPADLIEQVGDVIGTEESFSAYVSEALRRKVEQDRLAELVRELEEANGPSDPAEVERWSKIFRRQQ